MKFINPRKIARLVNKKKNGIENIKILILIFESKKPTNAKTINRNWNTAVIIKNNELKDKIMFKMGRVISMKGINHLTTLWLIKQKYSY